MIRLVFAVFLWGASLPVLAAVPVNGHWYTDNKDSIVEIGPCGALICGKIAKIIAPTADGKPPIDRNNPNPNLRNRPILGLTLLSGFKDAGKEWMGSIYDPRSGRTYRSTLTRLANGHLRVKGCLGFFCRSVYFTPVQRP